MDASTPSSEGQAHPAREVTPAQASLIRPRIVWHRFIQQGSEPECNDNTATGESRAVGARMPSHQEGRMAQSVDRRSSSRDSDRAHSPVATGQ